MILRLGQSTNNELLYDAFNKLHCFNCYDRTTLHSIFLQYFLHP